jgi:thioredoxin reductase (NADPH)
MVRSIILRGFDRDMAERLQKVLEKDGIKFLNKCIPVSFSKNEEKVICEYKNNESGEIKKRRI